MNRSWRDIGLPIGAAVVLLVGVLVAGLRSGSATPGPDEGPVVAETTTTTTTTSSSFSIDPPPDFPLQPGEAPTVAVTTRDDLARLVELSPPGTTFVLEPGVHRGHTIVPRDRQVFLGRPGAVMSGAVVLTGFSRQGEVWALGGQSAEAVVHGQCEPDRPRCNYSHDLFIDDGVLRHVGSVSEVGPGTWFFDYERDTVYLGDDPAGRTVELSTARHAFHGAANEVTLRGLVIEKYASPAQEGVIDSRANRDDLVGGSGWSITDLVVRWNHGVGIAATTGATVSGNVVYENGQLGLAAKGAGVTIEDNEVYGNNTAGFSSGWEAGGSKFAYTSDLVVRNNYVHDNRGPGLWTDIDNIDTLYENNRVIDNDRMGIFHEISYDAVITGNEVRGNGFGFDAWVWGAGIIISTSTNVQVADNLVEGNADGIIGVDQDRSDAPASYGPLSLANVEVRENVIRNNGGWTGIGQDVGSNVAFESANNRFVDNVYEQEGRHYFWLNDERTFEEWQAFGNS